MQKPDKVLRFRPLKEVKAALAKLQRVVLFHPKPLDEKLPPEYCYCKDGERKRGTKSKSMVQCVGCWNGITTTVLGYQKVKSSKISSGSVAGVSSNLTNLGSIGGFLLGT